MRIVAGRHRGRSLVAPGGTATRPTAGLAREALFNVLSHGRFAADGDPLAGATVLDAFAGSGANGLEALSRGAEHAVFMENDRAALNALRENLQTLDESGRATVVQCDVTRPPRATRACDVAIVDAPYGADLTVPALAALHAAGWLAEGALVVVEIGKTEDLAAPEGFEPLDERRYGKAKLVFLRAA